MMLATSGSLVFDAFGPTLLKCAGLVALGIIGVGLFDITLARLGRSRRGPKSRRRR